MEYVAKPTQIKYKYGMGLSSVANAHKASLLEPLRRLGTMKTPEQFASQHGQTNWKSMPLKTR